MRTVKDIAELHRVALGTGAEVHVDGKAAFNAGRAQVVAPRTPPVVVVPPAPPAAPVTPPAPAPAQEGLSRAEVERLLDAQREHVNKQFAIILNQIRTPPTVETRTEPREWDFTITYDSDHAITNVNAKARP